jgi:hypothetical protein
VETTDAPEVQSTAAPTKKALPPCSEITDPFEVCEPDVESGAFGAALLAALALLQMA